MARIYHSFCGPPGAASDSFRVVLRGPTPQSAEESFIFKQEDYKPLVHWTANDQLVISPSGWSGFISRSELVADGVHIDYAIEFKAASEAFAEQQKRITKNFEPDQAERINGTTTLGFARFRS